eukprot:m.186064 g.186064  ORF g.186064 m.186064 type:complete len:251 (-) comp18128_c0_seq4:1383-2135(-)
MGKPSPWVVSYVQGVARTRWLVIAFWAVLAGFGLWLAPVLLANCTFAGPDIPGTTSAKANVTSRTLNQPKVPTQQSLTAEGWNKDHTCAGMLNGIPPPPFFFVWFWGFFLAVRKSCSLLCHWAGRLLFVVHHLPLYKTSHLSGVHRALWLWWWCGGGDVWWLMCGGGGAAALCTWFMVITTLVETLAVGAGVLPLGAECWPVLEELGHALAATRAWTACLPAHWAAVTCLQTFLAAMLHACGFVCLCGPS